MSYMSCGTLSVHRANFREEAMDGKGPPVLMTEGQSSGHVAALHSAPGEETAMEEGGGLESRVGNDKGSRRWKPLKTEEPCVHGGRGVAFLANGYTTYRVWLNRVAFELRVPLWTSVSFSRLKMKPKQTHSVHELQLQDGHSLSAFSV